MSKVVPLLLSFLVLAATASAATAQTIRIGSVTNARFGGNWTLDGGQM